VARIACLAPYVPHVGTPHAGGQFLHRYLTFLAGRNDVALIAPDGDKNRAAVPLAPAGVRVHLLPMPARSLHIVRRIARYVRTSADGLTLGLGEKAALQGDATARRIVEESDIVEVQWSELLPLVPVVKAFNPSARIVGFEYDVRHQSLGGRRHHAALRRDRILATVAQLRTRRREPAFLNLCDAVVTVSAKDVGLLRALGVRPPTAVVAPSLTEPSRPLGPGADPVVLFVGAFDRPENSDGALWFLDAVWPAVVRACPGAKVLMVGANPPPALSAKAAPGVDVTGFVSDLDPLYRSAAVVVCPMLSGGGLKFKVPQAMLYGMPVVATSVAADGIVEESGASVFGAIVDDPSGMADAVISLLSDRRRATAVGAAGRDWALVRYRFDASIEDLLRLYDSLA